jgi:hypothetical protein
MNRGFPRSVPNLKKAIELIFTLDKWQFGFFDRLSIGHDIEKCDGGDV